MACWRVGWPGAAFVCCRALRVTFLGADEEDDDDGNVYCSRNAEEKMDNNITKGEMKACVERRVLSIGRWVRQWWQGLFYYQHPPVHFLPLLFVPPPMSALSRFHCFAALVLCLSRAHNRQQQQPQQSAERSLFGGAVAVSALTMTSRHSDSEVEKWGRWCDWRLLITILGSW